MSAVKQRRLSPKQLQFVKGITDGKPAYKAAMDAYDTDSPTVGNSIAVENRQKPSIQAAIEAEFKRQGVTIETIIQPVVKALHAVTEEGDEDIDLQLKGHDRAVKLLIPREVHGEGGITTNFNFFNVAPSEQDEFGLR